MKAYIIALTILTSLLLSFQTPCTADTIISLPDPDYSDSDKNEQVNPITPYINYIVYPVIGFPAIVTPEGELNIVISFDGLSTHNGFYAELSNTGDPIGQYYPLELLEIRLHIPSSTALVRTRVPEETPPDMFDLYVSASGGKVSDFQYNCVKVTAEISDSFRFIHFCDSQKDDPTGWGQGYDCCEKALNPNQAIGQVIDEIRFRDPDFALLTGDIVFGLAYQAEYEYMHERLRKTRVPIFMVPGNHDGYATETFGELIRDGFNHYRETLGPLYYSFEYGSFMFIGINSYDDPRSRRTGISILIPQWGGRVEPQPLNWLEQQCAYGYNHGKNVICFGHHDPRGPYNPLDYIPPQIWNHKSSGLDIRAMFDLYDVSGYLFGHEHDDEISIEGNTGYVMTTSIAASTGTGCWGYRMIEVEDGEIVRINYKSRTEQSVPLGNVNVTYTDNDGEHFHASALVENDLETDVSGKLEFYMLYDENGYAVTGGTVTNVVDLIGHSVYYVSVDIPQLSDHIVYIDSVSF